MKEVAVGIILKDGQVLACQRRRDATYPLKWEFPGGKLEPGESAEQALERELREELTIEVLLCKEFFRQEWLYGEGENGKAFRVFYFLIEDFSGELVNLAFEKITWTSPDRLQTLDILEGNREAVERLAQYAKEQQAA